MLNELMIIVTGANGFIGSALVWELNQAGIAEVFAVDSVSPEERPNPLQSRNYSQFMDANAFIEKVKKNEFNTSIEGLFHMGACSSTTETDEDFLKKNNTDYSKELFRFCTRHEIPLIYASSASVYGDGGRGFDDEKATEYYKPLHGYGRSKALFDMWAEVQSETPPQWYGLRFFNVYGPNEYHKGMMCSVVYKAFQQIRKNGKLKLFKSYREEYEHGKQMRDFVYVKDVTKWMLELFNSKTVTSGIYNMGYGKARTWLDLATATFNSIGKPVDIDWIEMPEEIKNQYQYFTEAKMDKLLSQNVSKPYWSLEEGIKDYVTKYLTPGERYL